MKDMKFEVKNEQHSKEIQECLFKLGFVWNGTRDKEVQFTESAYLFAYAESKTFTKYDTPYSKYFKDHSAVETTLEELKQMLNQTKKQPHVHADLIKSWADGAEIQYKAGTDWFDCHNNKPDWDHRIEYRIKPELSDIQKYDIEVGDIWYIGDQYHFVISMVQSSNFEDGWKIRFSDGLATSKGHLLRKEANLIFRRGVIDRLNEL